MHTEMSWVPDVLAIVSGKPFTEIPHDLFIPPDALEILLDSFSGPLDLLLYLIRRQNIDIFDIPVAIITKQYMQYIQLIEDKRLELAADYLVMAALLAEIKSKMLLPVNLAVTDENEEDPRMLLVRRLQAYELFKQAAHLLDELPRYERDIFQVQLPAEGLLTNKLLPSTNLAALVECMASLLKRNAQLRHHQIKQEFLSVRARINEILTYLPPKQFTAFTHLYKRHEGRMGLVVSFLAILELARQSILLIVQPNLFALIHVKVIDHG